MAGEQLEEAKVKAQERSAHSRKSRAIYLDDHRELDGLKAPAPAEGAPNARVPSLGADVGICAHLGVVGCASRRLARLQAAARLGEPVALHYSSALAGTGEGEGSAALSLSTGANGAEKGSAALNPSPGGALL